MESNLLQHSTRGQKPWRAGTPGRAPRSWRAVVDYRRPLRLFVIPLLLLATFTPAGAQLPQRTSLQLRLGAMYSTPLVKDLVSSVAVDTAFPGVRSNGITVRPKLAPIATVALRLPVRSKTQLEFSAAAARTQITADDGLVKWDVASATIANLVFGLAYAYRSAVVLHGGVGVTRIFTAERGLFTRGNSAKPLLEAGASTAVPLGARRLDIDARVQSHSFGTGTLRDNGGSDGSILRAVLQIGTTLWQGHAR